MLSHVWLFCDPMDGIRQGLPLSTGFPRQENWKYIGGDSSWAKLKQFLWKQEARASSTEAKSWAFRHRWNMYIFSNCLVRRGTPGRVTCDPAVSEEWKYERQSFCKGEKISITYKRQDEGYAEERHQLAASGTLMEHWEVWADKTLASCEGAVAKRGKASVLRSCNVSVGVLPAGMRLFIHPNFPYTLLKNTDKRVHPIKITFWRPPFTLFFDVDHFKIHYWICYNIASVLAFRPQGVWDLGSLTRIWTHTPCIGRQSLNHWTTGEVAFMQF